MSGCDGRICLWGNGVGVGDTGRPGPTVMGGVIPITPPTDVPNWFQGEF